MNERQAAAVFLRNTLAAYSALTALLATPPQGVNVYEGQAPESTPYPLVIFSFQSGATLRTIGADYRDGCRLNFLIKGVAKGNSSAVADNIAHQFDAALAGAAGTVTVNGKDYHVRPAGMLHPYSALPSSGGVVYRESGGIYEVYAQALTTS